MHYQQKMDNIFAKGSIWKHRTLRTLFDPFSSEYEQTTLDKKVEILKVIIENNLNLTSIIKEYKQFYLEENKQHVVNSVEDGLTNLLSRTLVDR